MTERQETLELYKTFVETITANEHRRQSLSAVYTSLIASALALVASDAEFDLAWISLGVFVVALVWFLSVRYFRRLAAAKFEVVKKMEREFCIQPFALEWLYFKHKAPKEKGDGPEKRKWARVTLTHYDQAVPLLAMLFSGGYLLWLAYQGVSLMLKTVGCDT